MVLFFIIVHFILVNFSFIAVNFSFYSFLVFIFPWFCFLGTIVFAFKFGGMLRAIPSPIGFLISRV
jgi:hypothetical protein